TEEVVARIQPLWRKHAHVAQEERSDLFARLPNSGGRSNQFRAHDVLANAPTTKLIDCRLVQTDEAAKRPGNQVQFVLDDEIRRTQWAMRDRAYRGASTPRWVRISVVETRRPIPVTRTVSGHLAE